MQRQRMTIERHCGEVKTMGNIGQPEPCLHQWGEPQPYVTLASLPRPLNLGVIIQRYILIKSDPAILSLSLCF
jgi:hypothetical protein